MLGAKGFPVNERGDSFLWERFGYTRARPQGLGSDSLAFLQYTRLPEWHNSSLMKPEDEITAEDQRSNPFGGVPRRSRSVYDVIAERYDIVKELGAGGMGVVLHVFDRLTEEDVALKLIRPELARRQELVDRFKREVRLARQITHKRVCRTYELLRFEDTLAISMEYVDGDTLRELLRRLGGLGSRTVIRVAEEICSALDEAHAHGIVHRDLKPENIMLDREGHVKVMDFGIAHSLTFAHTTPGDVLGTPQYMAPEQALRGGQIDARTDIYLFGLLLYEMYTGSAAGRDLQPGRFEELVHQHQDVIPESSVQVIARCLQHAPSARYQSANDVALALRVDSVQGTATIAALPLGLRLFEVATRVEEELMGINSNLEGPCTWTETWQRLPKFLLNRQVITASTARSLELFRSIARFSTNWKEWSESRLATTITEGETLIEVLRAIPAPEFTVEEIDITLFQDENCITPLPQPVGVRVNIRYSDGSNASRMYPAGRKFRVGEQVNPWWETRRPYTRIFYRDSSGNPALAWDFAFPFVGFVLGAPATEAGDFALRLLFECGKTLDFDGPADITKETTEAIVNAANSPLRGGGGAVNAAIHRAGGPSILKECQKIADEIGHLAAGKAALTGGGRLAAKYVIHTVGPVYRSGAPPAETLASCYRESIRLADEHAIRSIAFPTISIGMFGYPVLEAAAVAVPATIEALLAAANVKQVRFVFLDVDTLRAYIAAFEKLHELGALSPLKIERNSP